MFDSYEILNESTRPDGGLVRQLKAKPRIDVPKVLKSQLGDGLYFVEDGEFEPSERVWKNRLSVPKLGEKLRISTEMRFQDTEPGKCVRTVDFDIEVRIFGIGGLMEKFIERILRDSYEDARILTNTWIHEKYEA